MGVGVGVDPRRDPQEDGLRAAPSRRHRRQGLKLLEVVHHNVPQAILHGLLQLLAGLVVAVEVELFTREAHRLGHGQLAAGHHVQAKPLLQEDLGQGRAQVRLGGVDGQGVRMEVAEGPGEGPTTPSVSIISIMRAALL